ncbi:MAG: hypothetical protein ABGU97_03075 [Xylella fastidiosa subsp. multiplex]
MQSLTLPWPSKDLSPNARVHWTRRSKAVKQARGYAEVMARCAGWGGLFAVAVQGPVTERTGALDTAQQSRKTGQRLRRGDGTVCRMGWPVAAC